MSRADQKEQYELRELHAGRAASRLPPPLPPHLLPSAPPAIAALVDPYARYCEPQLEGKYELEQQYELELKDDAAPQSQRRPPLPPRPARPSEPANATQPQPQPRQVPRVLDAGQAQARQLTASASTMTFRIHDVLVTMDACAFDDLPEMTTWLNRGIFQRGEFIRDSPLRVLVSLETLMQSKYRQLFRGWAQEIWDYRHRKQRRGGVFNTSVIVPELRYFFYGDSIGVLYERWIRKQRRTWCCGAAVYTA